MFCVCLTCLRTRDYSKKTVHRGLFAPEDGTGKTRHIMHRTPAAFINSGQGTGVQRKVKINLSIACTLDRHRCTVRFVAR